MPFANPIIGGGGALVYPAIHSPNFSIPLKMGWSIDKNGNAYFFGIVTSGVFQGTNFILNSSGLFLYTGTPAAGNLFLSIASVAGTDAFTNAYKAGIAIYNTSGTDYLQLTAAVQALINIATGNAAEATPGQLLNQVTVVGSSVVLATTMRAPKVIGQNVNSFCSIVLISPSADHTTQPSPEISFVINDGAGSSTSYTQNSTQFIFNNGPINMNTLATPTTPANGIQAFASAATGSHQKYVNNEGILFDTGRVIAAGPNNQSISSTSFVALTGMSVSIGTGTYMFRIRVFLKANAAAGQWEIEPLFSGVTSFLNFSFKYESGSGVVGLNANRSAFSVAFTGPNPSVVDFYWATFEGIMTVTTAGTLSVDGATTVAADTWNCFGASYIEAFPI